MPTGRIHSPLPASLRSECEKASMILESFITPSITGNPGAALSRQLAKAKGLVILTGTRAAFLGSLRIGSGLVVARLENGTWSAPSGVVMFGGGFGAQAGLELTDFVIILNNSAAVEDFAQSVNFALSTHLSIAFGVGRNAEVAGVISPKGVSSMYAYSKTKGLYGGAAVEGSFYIQAKPANNSLYQCKVTAKKLLNGEIPPPPEAESLIRILSSEPFSPSQSQQESSPEKRELPAIDQNQPQPEQQPETLPELSSVEQPRENQRGLSELPANVLAELPAAVPVELPVELPAEEQAGTQSQSSSQPHAEPSSSGEQAGTQSQPPSELHTEENGPKQSH